MWTDFYFTYHRFWFDDVNFKQSMMIIQRLRFNYSLLQCSIDW